MSVAQRFGGKEATEYKPQTWTGEKGSVHSIQDGMAELGRITARQHDESHGCRRSKRQTDGVGLDTRNAGMSQETVDDFEEMDRKLSQVPISCTKGEAKHHLRIPERSGFMAWKQMVSHFDPRTGADRSAAYGSVTHLVSQSGLASSRPKTLWSARNIMQTWEQEVAEFDLKYS